jgi:hypothetical protein
MGTHLLFPCATKKEKGSFSCSFSELEAAYPLFFACGWLQRARIIRIIASEAEV